VKKNRSRYTQVINAAYLEKAMAMLAGGVPQISFGKVKV
jgi:hypothetical protein